MKTMTDAEEIFSKLYEKNRDVLDPLIERVNQCTLQHDGDSVFFIQKNLVTIAEAIRDMLKAGTVIPAAGPEARSKMN